VVRDISFSQRDMSSDWQSPKVQLPPQGTKLLWFKNGDVFVAQRMGNKYVAFIPGVAKLLSEPLLWKSIELPAPYTGVMLISCEGENELMPLDELEIRHPESYREFIDMVGEKVWEAKN
jgi:hypothetical protein